MAIVTSGDDDILALRLTVPRIGVWTADVLFDEPNPRSGKVSLVASNGQTFNGTIDRGGEFEDVDRTRVVAGAGGMSKNATPRQYNSATVSNILNDLAKDSGETISSTADAAVMATGIDLWTTSAEPIGNVVRNLMTAVGGGALWRMLPDGTLWVGRESWPDSGLDADTYQVMSKRFEDGSWMVSVDEHSTMALAPGTTFEGQRVSLVIHRIDDEAEPGPRMRVYFSDPDEGAQDDRLAVALEKVIRGATAGSVDYRAMYRAQVIAQSGTTVHVEPEIPGTLPDMGTIPLYVGMPGVSFEGVMAGNVLVGWRGGDRSKAYALCFDMATTVDTMTIAANIMLALGGPKGLPLVNSTLLEALAPWLVEFGKYIAGIQGVADPPKAVTPDMAAATTTLAGALTGSATTKVIGT